MEEDLFESEDMNEFFDAMEKAEGRKLYMLLSWYFQKIFKNYTKRNFLKF